MNHPINQFGAGAAGHQPPSSVRNLPIPRATTVQAPPQRRSRAGRLVAGAIAALAVVALGGYVAAAGLGGQPNRWADGAGATPTETAEPVPTTEPSASTEPAATTEPAPSPEPAPTVEPTPSPAPSPESQPAATAEPTDAPQPFSYQAPGPLTADTAREQALTALAAEDLIWTITVWGFPDGAEWQDLYHTTTDGSVLHSKAWAEGSVFIESLTEEVGGQATDTTVYHTGQTWYTQSFPLDTPGITPFTSTIPIRVSLLKDLIQAANPAGVEDDAFDQAVWCFSVDAQDMPLVLKEIGGLEATICLDQTSALPVRLTATYDNQSLRDAYLNPNNHNYLNLPEMLTHQWGDCWAVDVPDQPPPPGNCSATVTWSWSQRSAENDPLALTIPPDYREVAPGELSTD